MNDVANLNRQQQPGPNQVQLSAQQIAQACKAGADLLNNDERVNVPPSMAKSGDFLVLDSVLNALARGEAVVTSPAVVQEYEALKKASEEAAAGKVAAEE